MTANKTVGARSQPGLTPHCRLQFDKARNTWTIQAPERVFLLDETAHAVISRCDGVRSLGAIIDELCETYEGTPRDAIESDVIGLVQDFVDKGILSP